MKIKIIKILLISTLFTNFAYSEIPTYQLNSKNFHYITSNILEFDIFLKHTNSFQTAFEYMGCQLIFNFNPNFANGGTLTYSFIASDLPLNLRPRHPAVFENQLRLATNTPLGVGNTIFVSSTANNGEGTHIARMRLQTSATSFAGYLNNLNLSWRNSNSGGLYTKIAAYVEDTAINITNAAGHSVIGDVGNELNVMTGMSVVTSFDWTNPAYNVVKVIDTRNRPQYVPGGNYWNAPQYAGSDWTKAMLGSVYGIALDDNSSPNIFVARSTVFCYEDSTLRPDSAIIYRLDGGNWGVSTYVRCRKISGPPQLNVNWIPNTGSGLGNLCYDIQHQQMFVTNHEDGRIYRISDNGSGLGIVRSFFDPFGADNGAHGFAPLGERLWGIGTYGTNVNDVRVYFSKWKSHEFNYHGPNEIWSIALSNIGAFIPSTLRLEITLSDVTLNSASPVSDIEFSFKGDMLLGERSMGGDMGVCDIFGGGGFSHNSRILEYARDSIGLYSNYILCKVGSFLGTNNNSNGGVDYGYGIFDSVSQVISNCDSIIVGTGDALIYDEKNQMYVYGVQLTQRSSAGASNFQDYSHFIDLDGIIKSYDDKTYPGDIDVYRRNLCSDSSNVVVTPNFREYATLSAAFTAINAGTHGNGAITVTIIGNTTELTSAVLNGGVFTSCLIRPSGVRTVTGNLNLSVIDLNGADNVTVDGLNTGGNSLTVINPNAGTVANGLQCSNGASNNIFRNVTVIGTGASGGTAGGRGFNIGSSTAGTAGNNGNTIENCTTDGFRRGIQNFGSAGLFINEGTIVRNCKIKNFTSIGIFIGSEVSGNIVELNEVFHDVPVVNDNAAGGSRALAIQGCGSNIIRKNIIHGLQGSVAGGFWGIITIPATFTAPIGTPVTRIEVYNNMVALNNCIFSAPYIYGIGPISNTTTTNYTANVYNNSIRIGGSSGATSVSTIGLRQGQDGVHGPDTARIYNNVSINERVGGSTSSFHIGHDLNPAVNVSLEADNNIGFASDSLKGWDLGYKTTVYKGSLFYQDSTVSAGIEQHTMALIVSFVSATDLHLAAGTVGGNMYAKPSSLVTVDYDNETRNAIYPYRGADEGAAFKLFTLTSKLESRQVSGALPAPMEVILRLPTSPYEIIASNFNYLENSNSVVHTFGDALISGSFYVSCFTLGHIQTWSALPVSFVGPTPSYDFTSARTQAFSSNQTLENEFYGGDVNQDEIIEGTDGSLTDYDAYSFLKGLRLRTDINYDGTVDGIDLARGTDNAFNYIVAIYPAFTRDLMFNNKFAYSKTNSEAKKNSSTRFNINQPAMY